MSKGVIAPSDPAPVPRLPTEADTDLESRLDRAAWLSLVGPHAGFALGRHGARRYRPEYAPFAAVAEPRDPGCWVDLAALYQVDETAVLSGPLVSAHRPR